VSVCMPPKVAGSCGPCRCLLLWPSLRRRLMGTHRRGRACVRPVRTARLAHRSRGRRACVGGDQARCLRCPPARGGLLALSAPAPHDSGAVHARPAPPSLQLVDVAQHRPMEYPWLPALTAAGADAAPEPGAQAAGPCCRRRARFRCQPCSWPGCGCGGCRRVDVGPLTGPTHRHLRPAAAGAAPPPVAPAAGFEAAPSKRRNKPRRQTAWPSG
jgi:hypothetical protein